MNQGGIVVWRLFAPLFGMAIASASLATPAVAANASAEVVAASYTITPNPIAPPGSLYPNGSVTLTLTAHQSGGAVAPNAVVWLNVVGWSGSGHWMVDPAAKLTVHSTLLNTHHFATPVYEFRVNSAGKLTMTFTEVGLDNGEAGVYAQPTGKSDKNISPSLLQAVYQYVL
jgi:hypothetical protein